MINLFKKPIGVCPLIQKPCIKSNCLSYNQYEATWDNDHFKDESVEGAGDSSLMLKKFKGTVCECRMNVFPKRVENEVELGEEELINQQKASSLILSPRG